MSLSFANALNSGRPPVRFPIGGGLFSSGPLDVTFDSSYPGGYTITPGNVDMARDVIGIKFYGWKGLPASGVGRLEWDGTNSKLIVMADGSEEFIKIETVAITSNAGRLSRPPGYIIAARAAAGGTTGSLRIIPVGETVATKQMAVNLVTGAVSTFATDAVTSVVVVYIPLGVGPFIEANRVVDEAKTGVANTFNLTNRAALIQYIWNDTGNNLPAIQPVGEAPGSAQIAIDIQNSGNTTITLNAGQGTDNFKCTYWKFSALGLDKFAWTDQADITITSTTLFAFADDLAVPPNGIWVPGFGNVIVGEATATNHQAVLVDPSGTPATDVATYDPHRGKIVPVVGDGYTTIEMPYVILNEANCPALGGQIPTGFNLTGLIARCEFIGR